MTTYTAPEGKVYDWAEPHTGVIKDLDGKEIPIVEHLYAKYVTLGQFDSIDRYKLVDAPGGKHREVEIIYDNKA